VDLSVQETVTGEVRIGSGLIMVVKGFTDNSAGDPALERTILFVCQILKGYLQSQAEIEGFSRELLENYEVINMLYRVSDALGNIQDINRVSSIILTQAVAITHAQRGSVLLLSKDGESLRVAATCGFDSNAQGVTTIDLCDTICAEVMRTGKPLMIEDISTRPDLAAYTKGTYDTGSFISIPLQVVKDDKVKQFLGVLNLSDKLTAECFRSNEIKLLNALTSQASIAIANAQALEDLRQSQQEQEEILNELIGTYENLEKRAVIIEQINKIALSINATHDLGKIFGKICLYAQNLTQAGDVLVFYKDDAVKEILHSTFTFSGDNGPVELSEPSRVFFLQLIEGGAPKFLNHGCGDDIHFSFEGLPRVSVHSFLGVPFFTKGVCIGVVALVNKLSGKEFTSEDCDIIKTLGHQAANAVENARLIADQKAFFLDTILALAAAVDAKDSYTHDHSKNVSNYSRAIGEEMHLSPKQMEILERAAILHDIGKIAVPGSILNKPDRLDREEFEIMQTHALTGVKIVENIREMEAIVPGMKYHHERYDGKGYPEGLKGEQIPLLARILAVADTYDAITSDRPYRKGPGHDFAVEEIQRCSGSQFAPDVVEAFLKSSICTNQESEIVTKA
jgi:putative nucleotidyltransferase with HDIG domain